MKVLCSFPDRETGTQRGSDFLISNRIACEAARAQTGRIAHSADPCRVDAERPRGAIGGDSGAQHVEDFPVAFYFGGWSRFSGRYARSVA